MKGLGFQIGSSVSCDLAINATGYYFALVDVMPEDFFGRDLGIPSSGKTNQVLINRVGMVYPYYYEQYSRRVIDEPYAGWTRVKSIPWTLDDLKAYKITYTNVYPWHQIDWGKVNCHHIKPREFGGTNDFYNVLPVETNFHINYFNNFF
ncbi:hypothetical protein ACVNS2_19365 [Paenibacillus caseinilyticus]|uniref:hypothetical protein n=1 Tax=Paenibacillus mucilaginosus TaxID=61624 RepID=UPI000FFF40B5|nr:hypothetical protein [Paenibacillus mucilaginosus]